MVIAFHSNQLCERGTEIALFDYAHYNETILKNTSLIFTPRSGTHVPEVIQKFEDRFTVVQYDDFNEIDDRYVDQFHLDAIYFIRSGSKVEKVCNKCRSVEHFVFKTHNQSSSCKMVISDFVNSHSKSSFPVVNHIVIKRSDCKSSLREELQIPENAVVFGIFGGETSFNLNFVKDAIRKSLEKNSLIYFLYMNIKPDIKHNNIRYIERTIDLDRKQQFINTCDYLLHGRIDGETFGLAVLEFLILGKKVFTWKPSFWGTPGTVLKMLYKTFLKNSIYYATNHFEVMGTEGYYYTSKRSLMKLFLRASRNDNVNSPENFLQMFSPDKIMNDFSCVFNNE